MGMFFYYVFCLTSFGEKGCSEQVTLTNVNVSSFYSTLAGLTLAVLCLCLASTRLKVVDNTE